MGCGQNIKQTCGKKSYATCVYYELPLPEISSLVGEECVTVEETTDDLYTLVQNIQNSINVLSIDVDCVDMPADFTIADLVEAQNAKICELEDEIATLRQESICDKSIEDCGLDLGTLLDDCGEPVTTLGQYLQIIANNLQN